MLNGEVSAAENARSSAIYLPEPLNDHHEGQSDALEFSSVS